ncbi:MAG: hypothetical protein ACK4ZM_00225 [bacterium]
MKKNLLKNLNPHFKYSSIIIFIISLLLATVLSSSTWKLKIKGTNKEVTTNPIIKGTSVFVDIYDLSNLFNIDYEVNLTRKYITFYKIPTINTSKSSTSSKTSAVNTITTTNTTTNTSLNSYANSEKLTLTPESNKFYSNQFHLNQIILSKLSSINTLVISNPIDQVKIINDNNYKTYTDDIENTDKAIKSTLLEKPFKKIVLSQDFKLEKLDLNQINTYLNKNDIDAALVPLVKKYYYYEKDGNTLIPTVEIQINYLLINKQGEILFFSVQNISRTIAVLSSGSVRYRKSKLIDLTKMSAELFLRDYNEYIEIIKLNSN